MAPLLLLQRRRPNDHIGDSVPRFNGMELIYHYPHGAALGGRQGQKQQRLWSEREKRTTRLVRGEFSALVFSCSKSANRRPASSAY